MFRGADKFAGAQHAPMRMTPADQRLQADDPARSGVHLRLIDEEKLVFVQGVPQFRGQGEARADFGIHGVGKEPERVSSLPLGAVERHLGKGEQRLGIQGVTPAHGNANAYADANQSSVDRVGLAQYVQQLARENAGVLRAVEIDFHDGEFVRSETRDHVRLADVRAQPFADSPEERVSPGMAQRVIHILEMIEIEMQQGEAFSAALHASDAFLNPLRERGAVKQAGERIESRHGQDFLFGALALGNVARDGDGKAFRPHLHRRKGKFDGDFGPVFS